MKKAYTATEIKVGIFVIIALVALGYLSIRLGEEKILTKKTYPIAAIFDDVSGLVQGARVEMAGVRIGRVSKIYLSEGKALVEMDIFKGIRISKDAMALVRTQGLLGDCFIEIRQGKSKESLSTQGLIVKTVSPMNFEQLMSEASIVIRDIQDLTASLKEIFGTEEGRQNLERLVVNLREAAQDFKIVGERLAKGEGTFGKLLTDDSIYKHLDMTVSDLEYIVQKVKSGNGTLGRLLIDESLYNELEDLIATTQKAASSLEEISTTLGSGKGTLGKLLADEELYNKLVKTAERLDYISRKLEKGEGTLGRLLNDETLYYEIKDAVTNINRAAVGVQEVVPITVLGTVGSAVLH